MGEGVDDHDVIVVGSGGAGLTAATVAALHGLRVLLVEKTAWLGGTTALSGGGIWVPCSAQARAAGLPDSAEEAATYVRAVVGPTLREDLLAAFLDAAPRMVDFLHRHTEVRFALMRGFGDWHPGAAGWKGDGRLLGPEPFDARVLGRRLAGLRPPLRTFNAPGGMMVSFADLPHLLGLRHSWASRRHVAGLLWRHARDLASHGRGTRLVMGNALAGRLLHAARQAGVTLWRDAPMRELLVQDGRVAGIVIEREGRRVTLRARRGVVLASGGFSASLEMRQAHIPYPDAHVSLVPEGNTADGLRQAFALGARFDGVNHSNAGWVVVSTLRQRDGSLLKFPHLFLDRGKPGCIAVNAAGGRFGNESAPNLVEPMHRSGSVPAHLVCDDDFIHRHGLGLVRPGGWGLRRMQAAGYVVSAATLAELAGRIGCDPAGLETTVRRFNAQAEAGHDPDFGRGQDPADHAMGDRMHRPNPCLGPLRRAPFHAVRIHPGDSTTTLGLRVDTRARVLDAEDRPIPGLHAAGTDMNSLWRGRAPGNGANNTLGMTFGYIAACALADRSGQAQP